MAKLDDMNAMKALDPSGVLDSTSLFPKQCEQAWREARMVQFPPEYKQVKNVVVCGMGGSRFTPRTIKELFRDRITVPYEIVDDYTVPEYVTAESLVILSSFSGTTEEIISCGEDAIKKGAKLTAIAKGGKVLEMMKTHGFPHYQFDGKYNPCGQPRIGGGYLLMGHVGLLSALGFLTIDDKEVMDAVAWAQTIGDQFQPTVTEDKNVAKQLAKILLDTHPFLITAEFLKGFANGFANQINETAKMISDYRYISELNHHLMEGLKRPDTLHQTGLFVFIQSQLYSVPIQKRFGITKEVVEKQNVATHVVDLTGPTKLAQVLEAYTLSGFTSFYMAVLYDTDPVAIPWVDYFKVQLAK